MLLEATKIIVNVEHAHTSVHDPREVRAVALLHGAAALGQLNALRWLAMVYRSGTGCKVDMEKSSQYAQEFFAARRPPPTAQDKVALTLFRAMAKARSALS